MKKIMNNVYITNNIYKNNIYERYKNLKNSNKIEFDNNDLWKIFEYYSCIKLTEEYRKQFYEYNDMIYYITSDFSYYTASDFSYYICICFFIIINCKCKK